MMWRYLFSLMLLGSVCVDAADNVGQLNFIGGVSSETCAVSFSKNEIDLGDLDKFELEKLGYWGGIANNPLSVGVVCPEDTDAVKLKLDYVHNDAVGVTTQPSLIPYDPSMGNTLQGNIWMSGVEKEFKVEKGVANIPLTMTTSRYQSRTIKSGNYAQVFTMTLSGK
ncbi:TPA: hypothetical protein G8O00_000961 [Salmonella enterica]|uniref:Type 1 fimbrial protein n=1 Tax=Salmonella enterica TaxID=28901 RepID=A0A747SPC2_SALER|nr:hypothetical protein [Salmonella enterica]HAF4697605.1 hypothetical protein [Salmonella enterica]